MEKDALNGREKKNTGWGRFLRIAVLIAALAVIFYLFLHGRRTDITVAGNISDITMKAGEEKKIEVTINNAPGTFDVSYDRMNIASLKWLNWTEKDVTIPLKITSTEPGRDIIHVFVRDSDDASKKTVADLFIRVTFNESVSGSNPPRELTVKACYEQLDLTVGESVNIIVTAANGELPEQYCYFSNSDNIVTVKWGDWVNDYACALSVTGASPGSSHIEFTVYEGTADDRGDLLCSRSLAVNVTSRTLIN